MLSGDSFIRAAQVNPANSSDTHMPGMREATSKEISKHANSVSCAMHSGEVTHVLVPLCHHPAWSQEMHAYSPISLE